MKDIAPTQRHTIFIHYVVDSSLLLRHFMIPRVNIGHVLEAPCLLPPRTLFAFDALSMPWTICMFHLYVYTPLSAMLVFLRAEPHITIGVAEACEWP
ncbi:uncharacterized protein EI90DRAFT_3071336 [Cantharellus anzutake]|uniref:uncharacterized protein n=1 Tax=Cantharellus anzutake TaxID=1750568 RepID=UPI001907846D|nr:uncharacterized protein EI90DRAFT_3071336 [Cantharellus anzutake]KAF8326054.1 hypothetical protein EI90DRAFT_3071336 [Cantharellus anzutake]